MPRPQSSSQPVDGLTDQPPAESPVVRGQNPSHLRYRGGKLMPQEFDADLTVIRLVKYRGESKTPAGKPPGPGNTQNYVFFGKTVAERARECLRKIQKLPEQGCPEKEKEIEGTIDELVNGFKKPEIYRIDRMQRIKEAMEETLPLLIEEKGEDAVDPGALKVFEQYNKDAEETISRLSKNIFQLRGVRTQEEFPISGKDFFNSPNVRIGDKGIDCIVRSCTDSKYVDHKARVEEVVESKGGKKSGILSVAGETFDFTKTGEGTRFLDRFGQTACKYWKAPLFFRSSSSLPPPSSADEQPPPAHQVPAEGIPRVPSGACQGTPHSREARPGSAMTTPAPPPRPTTTPAPTDSSTSSNPTPAHAKKRPMHQPEASGSGAKRAAKTPGQAVTVPAASGRSSPPSAASGQHAAGPDATGQRRVGTSDAPSIAQRCFSKRVIQNWPNAGPKMAKTSIPSIIEDETWPYEVLAEGYLPQDLANALVEHLKGMLRGKDDKALTKDIIIPLQVNIQHGEGPVMDLLKAVLCHLSVKGMVSLLKPSDSGPCANEDLQKLVLQKLREEVESGDTKQLSDFLAHIGEHVDQPSCLRELATQAIHQLPIRDTAALLHSTTADTALLQRHLGTLVPQAGEDAMIDLLEKFVLVQDGLTGPPRELILGHLQSLVESGSCTTRMAEWILRQQAVYKSALGNTWEAAAAKLEEERIVALLQNCQIPSESAQVFLVRHLTSLDNILSLMDHTDVVVKADSSELEAALNVRFNELYALRSSH